MLSQVDHRLKREIKQQFMLPNRVSIVSCNTKSKKKLKPKIDTYLLSGKIQYATIFNI